MTNTLVEVIKPLDPPDFFADILGLARRFSTPVKL